MLQEFKEFISKGNVLDLAVGIIIGVAFTGIVTSLVGDILMPVIGMITGGVDFSNFFIALKGGTYPSLKAAKDAGEPVVAYGAFINQIVNFLIVSFAIFIIVKQANRLKKAKKTPTALTTTEELLVEIRNLLKKG